METKTLSSPIFYGGIYLEVFREREKMDSRHPSLWFLVGRGRHRSAKVRLSRNHYIIIWCILQECGDFTWRFSDCEELVGITHREWRGWFWGFSYSSYEMRLDYPYFLSLFLYPYLLRYFSVSLRDSGEASNSSSAIVWTTSVISLIFFFVQSFFCSLFFSVPSRISFFSFLLSREIATTFCLKSPLSR